MASSPSYTYRVGAATLLACAIFAGGCTDDVPKPRTTHAPIDPRDSVAAKLDPVLHGTIGEFAVFADATPLPVEGYGVVAELPGTGSGDMQPNIRAELLEQLYRIGAGSYAKGTENIHPDQILSSNQVAAVEVRGQIPPLAKRGDRFDVMVSTVANSEATSIANGLLWTSELKVIGLTADTGGDTHTIAFGRGPIFIPASVNQIFEPADAEKNARALRSGRVIGGGIVGEDRLVRLQLFSPSYRYAAAIERAINSRFPSREKAAQAESDTFITLTIPPEYESARADYLELVKHMYLSQEMPGFSERKAAELIRALSEPHAPYRDISLALQGLGRSILPEYLEPEYTSPDMNVRFWTARAGAALQDVTAFVVLQDFINDPKSPLHNEAVQAVAEVSHSGETERATASLTGLLASPNMDERIAAYHGLVDIKSRAVHSFTAGRKFILDIIPLDMPPMIYVSQTGTPRIALIGRPITLAPDTLYVSGDNMLTVNVVGDHPETGDAGGGGNVVTASVLGSDEMPGKDAAADASKKQNVVLYWRAPLTGKTVTLKTSSNLSYVLARLAWIPDPTAPDYDSRAEFIGASYQRIVEMLGYMCKNQLLNAQFVLQEPPAPIATPAEVANDARPEGFTHFRHSANASVSPMAAPQLPPTIAPPPPP